MKSLLVALALTTSTALAQTGGSKRIPVTPDNFNRAESEMVFATIVKDGGLGKFVTTPSRWP